MRECIAFLEWRGVAMKNYSSRYDANRRLFASEKMSLVHFFLAVLASALPATFTGMAHAAPPVRLTSDKITVLDLTKGMGKDVDLLACGLSLSGKHGRYILHHANGKIPVPTKAVKQLQDDQIADIAVKAKVAVVMVKRLGVSYSETRTEAQGRREFRTPDGTLSVYEFPVKFLTSARVASVVSSFKAARPDLTVVAKTWKNDSVGNPIPKSAQTVVDVRDAKIGKFSNNDTEHGWWVWYPLSKRNTTIEFSCSLTTAQKN